MKLHRAPFRPPLTSGRASGGAFDIGKGPVIVSHTRWFSQGSPLPQGRLRRCLPHHPSTNPAILSTEAMRARIISRFNTWPVHEEAAMRSPYKSFQRNLETCAAHARGSRGTLHNSLCFTTRYFLPEPAALYYNMYRARVTNPQILSLSLSHARSQQFTTSSMPGSF